MLILLLVLQQPLPRRWVRIGEGTDKTTISIEKTSVVKAGDNIRRCWVRVELPNGKRIEAFVEVIRAHQARTLGERLFDSSGGLIADRTSEISRNQRDRPYENIHPNDINAVVWEYLYGGEKASSPTPGKKSGQKRNNRSAIQRKVKTMEIAFKANREMYNQVQEKLALKDGQADGELKALAVWLEGRIATCEKCAQNDPIPEMRPYYAESGRVARACLNQIQDRFTN